MNGPRIVKRPTLKNYIHQLQDRVAALEDEIAEMTEKELELVRYLDLPKFKGDDPTVQVTDILARLGRY